MSLDLLGRARSGFQFFAERCHKDTERGYIAFKTAPPYMLGDIGVGQNLSHVAGHQAQKLVLGRGQGQRLLV